MSGTNTYWMAKLVKERCLAEKAETKFMNVWLSITFPPPSFFWDDFWHCPLSISFCLSDPCSDEECVISGWRAREERVHFYSEKVLVRERRKQSWVRGKGWMRGGVWRFGCVLGVKNVQMKYGEKLVCEKKGSFMNSFKFSSAPGMATWEPEFD